MILTVERLREVLHYDTETGNFVWLVSTSNRVRVGAVAGNASGHEYHRIRVDGGLYYAHRLAVFYQTGQWPKNKVDHKSINKRDNAWDNLREATNQDNSANVPVSKNNSVGLKGVSRDGKRYRAHITIKGKYNHLGNFATPEEAHAAYLIAANDNFGEFARAA
jgi:hypothetical protein